MAVKYSDDAEHHIPKDAANQASDTTYDICIIGAGPVSITLATELAADTKMAGKRICVLESGSLKTSPYGNALRKVQNLGEIATKPSSRERVLGGATLMWGGGSAPMDAIDLEFRPFLSNPAGWPVSAAELAPFYERTTAYGFPPLALFETTDDSNNMLVNTSRLNGKRFIASVPPWDFVKKHQWIFYGPNVDLWLDATVLKLNSTRDTSGAVSVTSASIRSQNGTERTISAKIFVMAAGGLESARLLLLSRDTNPSGLGNERDQVGRYLMNHPKGNVGTFRLKRGSPHNIPYPFGNAKNGWVGYTGFRLSESAQRELGLLNSYFRLEPIFPWTNNKGVKALLGIIKHQPAKESRLAQYFSIVINLPTIAAFALYRLRGKKGFRAKAGELRNFMEMEPLPENRLTLSDERDENGLPVPAVNVNTSALDRKSLIELHRIFAEEMEKNGVGTLESNLAERAPWPINFDASHHLGGTRMGKDPKTSVADANLRVHTVSNLYICGGSVFPTSGCANPTYAMCALAVRLADTLKKKMDVKELPAPKQRAKTTGRKNIIVIGAGKRAQTDVLPAIEATGKFEITGVYAEGARRIYIGPKHYDVVPLPNLPKYLVRKAAWIYVGVPVAQVAPVLAFLEKFDTSTIGLILDTPVFPKKYLGNKKYFKNFAHVVAAEDTAYLPWIQPLKEILSEITSMTFNQSAYAYHGIALIKTLMNNAPIISARLKKRAGKPAVEITFSVAGKKVPATIIEPRDYKNGTFTISGLNGTITDNLADTTITQKIRPIIAGGLCVGLDIAGKHITFTTAQSQLIGLVPNDATVTSLTLELKRLGLVTLLSNLAENPTQVQNIESALADARLDERVHSFGRWFTAA